MGDLRIVLIDAAARNPHSRVGETRIPGQGIGRRVRTVNIVMTEDSVNIGFICHDWTARGRGRCRRCRRED